MNWHYRIEAASGSPVASGTRLAGGDLGGALLVTLEDGRRFVAKDGPLVEREGEMLRAIGKTGAPAPAVHYCDDGLLLMDHIEADGAKGWASLAEALGHLHAAQDVPYGWDADYAFGAVTVCNTPADDWPAFWGENRIACHGRSIDSSIARRLDTLASRLGDILPRHPTHSLLHGDLWGGNVLFHQGALAALIDPAAYIGHREVDIAMLTLFDHPPDAFFDVMQLDAGWRERLPAYRLWPLLVHLRLFGDSYRASVESALRALGF